MSTKVNPLIDHSLEWAGLSPSPVAEGEVLPQEVKRGIDDHLAKYPADQRQSAIMPALTLAQRYNGGYLTVAIVNAVADYLCMPPIAAQEVASFYSLYASRFQGRHKISFCANISCLLCGGDGLLRYVEEKLGIKVGEVTSDGRFSLHRVECLGACGGAPMMQIGDAYHENLTRKRVDDILDSYE